MSFFRICPRDATYNSHIYDDIPLKVVQSKGVDVEQDFGVDVTDLNRGFKHFKVNAGKGISFKISVIIHKNDVIKGRQNTGQTTSTDILETKVVEAEIDGEMMTFEEESVVGVDIQPVWHYQNAKVTSLLNYFMIKGIPFMITTDIIGINTTVPYLITENKSRKQEYTDYTVWDLTFTRYDEVPYSNFTKTNTGVTKALNKLKAKKKTQVKAKTTTTSKLSKCKINNIVYSKTKKTVGCVKLMQQVLYKEKFLSKSQVDGWYGSVTLNAVKKYQKKYAKKYGLKTTGRIDKATFNAMIGKGKLVSKSKTTAKSSTSKPKAVKTINIKSNTKGIVK